MPTYSYKGYDFEVNHIPTEAEFQQMSAYVDSLPPKESLVDKIPGIGPKLPEQPEPSLIDQAMRFYTLLVTNPPPAIIIALLAIA